VLMRTCEILQPPHIFAGLLYRGYRAIAIDSPTHFKSRTALQVANWNSRRDIEKHYPTMSFDELAALPLRDLSRKPDEFFTRVERYCAGPYLDLFARERRQGWAVWGDQTNLFNEAPRAANCSLTTGHVT
jgi:N6-adenosine-specific RNA methylase IME4